MKKQYWCWSVSLRDTYYMWWSVMLLQERNMRSMCDEQPKKLGGR